VNKLGNKSNLYVPELKSYKENLQATDKVLRAFRKKALDNIVTSMTLKYSYLAKLRENELTTSSKEREKYQQKR
jgi:hypothetical protein